MPGLIILISASVCVGSVVVVYFNRSNAAATGIAVFSFIALLYGVGQFVERDNVEAKSLGFVDASDRRAAKDAGVDDGERWRRYKSQAEARDKTKMPEAPMAARRQADVIPDDPVKQLHLPPPTQLNALGAPPPTVVIANFTSQKTAANYVEVSVTVVNNNVFPIKNIVVKCGDRSFAAGDVSAVVDRVVPAKSELSVARVRMGPIKPHLPPTTCLVEKYERAN